MLVLDTIYSRQATVGRDGRDSTLQAVGELERQAAARQLATAQQNQFSNLLNQRIAETLRISQRTELASDQPDAWNRWWNDQNQTTSTTAKQVAFVRQQNQVAIADRTTSSPASQPRHECLVAGTQIWTFHGKQAIEQIRVGDLVLAKNAETGELAYKPVLRTTIRPATPLVRLTVAGESPSERITASPGHVFWVSGRGWLMASELESGEVLHGLTGPVRIREVQPSAPEQTYNLVVADFSSYFVGANKIISHDFTPRGGVNVVVPGLLVK